MPGENILDWSVTAINNGNSDTSINWAEGQARSSVNDSARSMMAAHAKQRNLTNGTITTGGTADAQTFTSGISYTALPAGLFVRLAIGVGLTNTGAMTLNMDGIGAAAVLQQGGAALTAGQVVGNTYAEFLCNGTQWLLLDSNKVSKSGDTMTGDLHATNVYCTGLANSGGSTLAAVTCTSLAATGGVNFYATLNSTGIVNTGDLYNLSGTITTSTITVTGLTTTTGIINNGDLYSYGNAFKPGGGAWSSSSDARIKNVLGDYITGLAAINELTPVRYTFKGNDQDHIADDREYIGLIAQSVEAVMPEMVTQTRGHIDGQRVTDLRVLDSSALIYALINCVQELSQRIETLEAK